MTKSRAKEDLNGSLEHKKIRIREAATLDFRLEGRAAGFLSLPLVLRNLAPVGNTSPDREIAVF